MSSNAWNQPVFRRSINCYQSGLCQSVIIASTNNKYFCHTPQSLAIKWLWSNTVQIYSVAFEFGGKFLEHRNDYCACIAFCIENWWSSCKCRFLSKCSWHESESWLLSVKAKNNVQLENVLKSIILLDCVIYEPTKLHLITLITYLYAVGLMPTICQQSLAYHIRMPLQPNNETVSACTPIYRMKLKEINFCHS